MELKCWEFKCDILWILAESMESMLNTERIISQHCCYKLELTMSLTLWHLTVSWAYVWKEMSCHATQRCIYKERNGSKDWALRHFTYKDCWETKSVGLFSANRRKKGNTVAEIPTHHLSLSIRMPWSTVSKAAQRSRSIAQCPRQNQHSTRYCLQPW